MHRCPECGKITAGSYSEGGVLWSICEDCMRKKEDEISEIRTKLIEKDYEETIKRFGGWRGD